MESLILLAAVLLAAPAKTDAPVVLENDHLRVEFSAKDGSIVRLRNKGRDLELISVAEPDQQPWAMLLDPFDRVTDFTSFEITHKQPQQVDLQWQTPYDITVRAEARLASDSDRLELRCSAENSGERTIIALQYPAIRGIGTLSDDGAADRLLHSTMMGAVFRDPFHLFRGDDPLPHARGLVVSRYPNGFHGSTLQMMAYYTQDRGGFYVAALDSRCADKDLNFYKLPGNKSLTCELTHLQWDARPGKSLTVDYPVVIAPLAEGTWYEAARRYRTWAVKQPWCGRGTLRERVARGDASRWLLEEIAAVGMWWPFRNDIRDAIVRTRELFGAPLLHLELWWSHEPSRKEAQAAGDRFGPFYFPHLALKTRKTFTDRAADQVFPLLTQITPDWVAMCAAQPGWRKVFLESAEDMTGEGPLRHHQIWVDENRTGCNADALYYDIGPCAGVPTHCYAADHDHPPGAGRDVTQAHVSLFSESNQRASAAKGQYVPVGTECISEPFVGCMDMYYPRNAAFSLDMETFPYVRTLTWLPDGQMEIVPLWPFVYHEHGPLAMQGIYPVSPWSTPAGEDYLTWAEARAYFWGGLMTVVPVPADATISPERTAFLRSLVAARTGFARDFLAYGRMQQPPEIQCSTIDIDHGLAEDGWVRKVRFSGKKPSLKRLLELPDMPADEKDDSGELSVEKWIEGMLAIPAAVAKNRTFTVPVVMCQAYTLDNRLGLLLVNLRAEGNESIEVSVDPVSHGLPKGTYRLQRTTAEQEQSLGTFESRGTIRLELAPREVVLLTADSAEATR